MQIQAKDIQVVLNANRILKGVSMEAGDRELVGVIGPNGSGKSTLLKCIYRILKPTGGAVWLDGKQLQDHTTKESARKLAVVAQHNYYNFDFSVQDVVLMGRAPHKRTLDRDNAEDFRIVAEALETVGMAAFANRSFSTLSGGEQQRVILARALAQQTQCLILDEPTSGLDPGERVRFRNLLSEFAHDRIVLISTHIVSDVEYIATQNAVMKDGKLIATGTTEELVKLVEGKVWNATIPASVLPEYEQKLRIVNLRNENDGSVSIRYLAEQSLVKNSISVAPHLEDLNLYLFPQETLKPEVK